MKKLMLWNAKVPHKILPTRYILFGRQLTNLLVLSTFLYVFTGPVNADDKERDDQLELALDATLGIGITPHDRIGLELVLAELSEQTPTVTYARARAYEALILALIDGAVEDALQLLDKLEANDAINALPDALGEVLNARGEILLHREERQALASLVPRLKQQRHNLSHNRLIYHRLHLLGRSYELNHAYREALEYIFEALEVLMTIDDPHVQRRRQFLNLHRARILTRLRDYDRAYDLLNRTIDEAYRYGFEERLADLYIVRGYVNQTFHGANEEAIADFIKASIPAPGQPLSRTQMLALNNLGAIELHTQQYDSAYKYFIQSLAIAEAINSNYHIHIMRFNLGYVQVKQRDYANGLADMEAAFDAFEQIAPLNAQADMLGHLADAYQDAGQLSQALSVTQRQLRLREQAFNEEREQVISELQVRFEMQESELRIRLLERESALRDAQLSNQQRQQSWLKLIGLLLAFGLLLALLATRHVRKLNSRLSEANVELEEQSFRDPLTRLYNRRGLQKFPQQGNDLLVLIDIDHFKHINDEFGHEVGDQVLISVSKRLQEALRINDLVARWGGEEFLIVIRDVDQSGVDLIIKKIRNALDHSPVAGVSVTASGGAVLIRSQAESWESVIQRADELLYRAKAQGRGRIIGDINNLEQAWS